MTGGCPASMRAAMATWSRRVSSNEKSWASATTASIAGVRIACSTHHRRSVHEVALPISTAFIASETSPGLPSAERLGRHRAPIQTVRRAARPRAIRAR